MVCGSDNINVRVMFNLKNRQVVSHELSDEQCFCNQCNHWTTFGWIEVKEVMHAGVIKNGTSI